MNLVFVNYPINNNPEKDKIIKQLFWYDPIKQEMQTFEGGYLKFEYKEDQYLINMDPEEKKRKKITTNYRSIPKIEDLEITVYKKKTDKEKLKKWFNNYLNYNVTKIEVSLVTDVGMAFNVPVKEIEDFSYQLHRNGFEHTK
jgi:hypothetical protein